jgi:hypothetical protein
MGGVGIGTGHVGELRWGPATTACERRSRVAAGQRGNAGQGRRAGGPVWWRVGHARRVWADSEKEMEWAKPG